MSIPDKILLCELSVLIKKGTECLSPQGKVKNFVLTIKNDNW